MDEKQKFYQNTIEQTLSSLETTVEGLDEKSVGLRRTKFGLNKLPEAHGTPLWMIFLRQFKSPLIYILLAVTIAVLLLGEYADAAVIAFVLLFNSIIGTLQEGKAQNTLAALKHFVQTQALVRRSGMEFLIGDEELVPGDIVILREGDKVPADCRVLVANRLTLDEASLTGESEPVMKVTEPQHPQTPAHTLESSEQRNMVFKGTHVVAGNGEAVVIATGLNTEIGKISESVAHVDTTIPLLINIQNLSRLIIAVVGVLSLALLAVGIMLGQPLSVMIRTVISLAVSIIPEGLPVVMTLVLANGVWRMGKRRALVKRLAAVEALGQATVIAVDKTGTITKNELLIQKVYVAGKTFDITGFGYEPTGQALLRGQPVSALETPELALAGKLASFAAADLFFVEVDQSWHVSGDPTEGALLAFAQKLGFHREEVQARHAVVQEIPFDYRNKYRLVVYRNGHEHQVAAFGAPEAIMKLAHTHPNEIKHVVHELSSQGLRVIAFGFASVSGPLDPDNIPRVTFGGLYAMRDTLHPEVPGAVADVQAAGMRTVMITGDHATTAEAIGKAAGIFRPGDEVMTGEQFDTLPADELQRRLQKVTVFARVTPEDKLRIVTAFQKHDNIVAMTGDGVNDVPSLVAADLGIAMGRTGTEVTKEAADIVLLDDNFATIAAAVEEGRNIYKTIERAILYLFSTSLGELFAIAGAIIVGFALPVSPVQIIWLNLVTDGFLTIAFAMEPKHGNLLRDHYEKPNAYLVSPLMIKRMLPMAIIMMLGALWMFDQYDEGWYVKATTVSLTTLAVFQWLNAWNCRSERRSVFTQNPFSNMWLVVATIIVILLQIAALHVPFLQRILHTTPLTLHEWGTIILVGFSILVVEEVRKLIVRIRETYQQKKHA